MIELDFFSLYIIPVFEIKINKTEMVIHSAYIAIQIKGCLIE